ncbi:RipA family octameric membrane protein [Roseobacteraceae bacterium NS-SX3]
MNGDQRQSARAAFEEFKLFYESTEKVTDRRLESNRWNYSICVAILVAVAVLINWSLAKPSFILLSLAAVIVLSLMAALYCTLWIGQIRDYKALNNAKFDVLNSMAPRIAFGESETDPRISFCPFEKEWDSLQKANAVEEVYRSNLVALKASNMEYLIPRAFRILFLGIILAAIAFSVWNWDSVVAIPALEAVVSGGENE